MGYRVGEGVADELAGGAKHEGDADEPAARGQAEDPSAPLLD